MEFRRTSTSCCAALLLLAVAPLAGAASWNYGTTFGLSSDWNDNPALADDVLNPESTFRFLASYDGGFERESNSTNFSLRPRVTTDYYPDSKFSDLQATDLFLPGSFSYRRPLSVWSVSFNASQQSVLSDEATTSQETPIGTLRGDDTLNQFSLSPTLAWTPSEKDEFQFGLNYSLSDYDLEFTNRSDTTTVGGNFSYRRYLTERHTVGFSGLISSSESDRRALVPVEVLPPTDPRSFVFLEGEARNDSTSSYITADYNYALSDTSLLKISYGVQDATVDTVTSINRTGEAVIDESFDFGSDTFILGYQAEYQRGNLNIQASRTVTLDITNGQPQDRYQLTFDGDYEFTPKLRGTCRVLAWEQEAVALQALDQENLPVTLSRKLRYASTEFRLDWNLTRKWFLTGRYEYRWRDTDQSIGNIDQDLTAKSNQLTLGISYVWKALPQR